jgi:hypothetical protein
MLTKWCSELRIGAMRRQLEKPQLTSEDPSPCVEIKLGAPGAAQRVAVVATTQRLGGVRWWFSCPGCERRCAVLYRPRESERYTCRICTGAGYDSPKVSRRRRAEMQAMKIRARLEVDPADGTVVKPAGMHQSTYERLVAELRRFEWAAATLAPIPKSRAHRRS